MFRVGLTGNIAAGKSTVAEVWRSLGARIIDADQLAREAVHPGTPALARIVERWGADLLAADGSLDRAALRELVFEDPTARSQLEAIVHPAVRALRDQLYREFVARGEPIVVADIPLLFETGAQDEFEVVVLVDAPESERLRRLVEDRGLEADQARRMIAAQMPAEQKRALATYLLPNDGSCARLGERAAELWGELVALAAGKAAGTPARGAVPGTSGEADLD